VNAWTVRCATCQHRWNLVGNWSEYERQAIESRPCPKCGAYALCCPEPTRPTGKKGFRSVKWQPAKAG
jgi:hypothetical protein